jgi:GAF domain-containing protein
MQRRGAKVRAGKPRRTDKPATRRAPRANPSIADLQEQLDTRTRERDEALEQQAATAEVLKVISSSTGKLEPVFQKILENSITICEAKFGMFWLTEGHSFRCVALHGTSPAFTELRRREPIFHPNPTLLTPLGRIARSKQLEQVADCRAEQAYIEGEPGFVALVDLAGARTILVVPILRDDELVGAFNIFRQEVRPFTDKQIELVTNFADQAVIAIENTRLLSELRESLQRQTATADVLKAISSSPGDLEPVFDALLINAIQVCEAKFGFMYLGSGMDMKIMAHKCDIPAYLDFATKTRFTPETIVGRVVGTKQVVQVVDISDTQRYRDREPLAVAAVEIGGVRTILGVPLLREGEVSGAIFLYRQEVRPFTDMQIDLIRSFAAQAVIAIENTRLLNELRQRTDDLSEALEQQTATSKVLSVISSSPGELEPVFKTMLENATRLCEARYGTMWLREGDAFRAASLHGPLPPAYIDLLRSGTLFHPSPDTPTGLVIQTRQPVQVPDLRETRAYLEREPILVAAVEVAGVRTMFSVPMLKEDQLVGTISIYRQEMLPFTDKQIELVQNFAKQAVIAIENTRLLNELRQRTDDLSESLEQQTATSEVLKIISSSPGELEPVFQAILANATRICDAKFGVLFRHENGMFRAAATLNAPQAFVEFHRERGSFKPPAGTPLDRLLKAGGVIYSDDEATNPGAPARFGGARSLVTVPMRKDDQLIGAIIIYRQEVRPFTDEQIEFLTNFAAQAVIAIENTRLLSELRESLQQQTATADVLKVISRSTFDLKAVLNTLSESANRLCEADGAMVWRPNNEGRYQLAASFGMPPEFETNMRQISLKADGQSMVGRALQAKKTFHVPDMNADPEYAAYDLKRMGGYRAVLGIPLMREGVPIGAMMVGRQTPKAFTEAQIALVTTFADQAVIAIENVRLFDEVQARTRELAESLQQQTATSEVLGVISSSPTNVHPVFETIASNSVNLCGATYCIAYSFDGEMIRMVAHYNLEKAALDALSEIFPMRPDPGSVVGGTILERDVLHIEDVAAEPKYIFAHARRAALGIRTYLGVPMMREGQPIGVIALYRRDVKPFSDRQIELVKSFADQAVIAIENVRLFERVEARTRELAKSLEDLRTTQDRLVQTQKLALLGQLTAGIAHEIKNPLNFVNNFSGISAELIDELQGTLKGIALDDKARTELNELTTTLKGNFDKVVHHGRRADAIVKNMLQHSREGTGEHRVIEVNALVEESLNLAWHGARAETQGFEIKLKQSFDPSAGGADVFPQDIRRALLNVISNGFYAATRRRAQTNGGDYEPTLTASTKNLGDRVEIRIRDNGTGMAADVKEKMFNPFFTTKPTGEGTGLGLSISHDIIVKQHGGSIEVDTQPGEFTEITVILPRVAALLPERS